MNLKVLTGNPDARTKLHDFFIFFKNKLALFTIATPFYRPLGEYSFDDLLILPILPDMPSFSLSKLGKPME